MKAKPLTKAKAKSTAKKVQKPATAAQQAARFQKGNGGRRLGSTNKVSRDLKEGIIDAAVIVGSDGKGKDGLRGYLVMLARKHPKQYTGLLARVMPLQITGDVGGFIGQVNIVSVPVDRYLSPEDAKKLLPPADGDIVDAEFTEAPNKDEEAA